MAGGVTRLAAVVLLVLGFAPASFADGGAHHSGHGGHAGAAASDSPAVASPNLRFEVDYSFFEIESTDTFDAQGATTLSIDSHDGHSGRAALTAVFPIWGPLGGRAQVRGAYGHRLHSLDGLERGNNEVSASGAGVELFLRNPERYALAIGGGWDRLAQDGPADANEFGGLGCYLYTGESVGDPEEGKGKGTTYFGFGAGTETNPVNPDGTYMSLPEHLPDLGPPEEGRTAVPGYPSCTEYDEAAAEVLSIGSFTILQSLFLLLLYAPLVIGFVGLVAFAGIGELVACYKRAKEKNGTVKLLNPSGKVYDLLQLTKLEEVFDTYRDEKEALGSF